MWTKFALQDDPETGDTREDVKREIQTWVDCVFGEECGGENVSCCFSFSFYFHFILLHGLFSIYIYSVSTCK